MNPITILRRKRWIFLLKRRIKKAIQHTQHRGELKLNIGSGLVEVEGWINLDLPFFDIRSEKSWREFLGQKSFDFALLEHVFEHLTVADITRALQIAKGYMHAQSNIRIAVPDKNHPNPKYIDHVRPGGVGPGADDHKSFWSYDEFAALANELNLEIAPIEYYNSKGELIMNEMESELGEVRRTARKPRSGELHDYSSLIVDLKLKVN